jgi:tetratricopeptide (TPR) repeat protein
LKPDVDEIENEGVGRRWWGRIALVALGALFVPLLLEGLLGLAGYGYPTSFLLPYEKDGERVWVDNQFFGYRFFPQKATRTAQPILVPRDKEPGEYRVVVLGESAAMGDPLPDFGLPRVLEVLLADRMPGRRVRVINAAMTAINSHVVREIARELPRLQPDAVVVYLGNNEVIGPYGPGTVLRAFTASGAYIRGSVLLGRTRLGQVLARLRGSGGPGEEPEGWGGMTMFLEQELPWQDPRLDKVYDRFGHNLEAILATARKGGARVVVSTVAVSRHDCPPFGSRTRRPLEGAERATFDRLWAQGLAAEAKEDLDAAIASYEEVLALDDGYAELHYRLARCLERRGREADAELHYIAACDRDTLRFRADTRLNELVRRAARRGQAEFLDSIKALRHATDAGLFVDHVHFAFPGNVQLARLFADTLAPAEGTPPPPDQDLRRCAAALAYTPWDELEMAETIRSRMEHPPFNRQRESAARLQGLRELEDRLREQARAMPPDEVRRLYARALEQRPDDWVLRARRGGRLYEEGDLAGAAADLAAASAAVPHRFDVRGDLARCLAALGRNEEAVRVLRGRDRRYGHFLDHILRRISDDLIERAQFAGALPFLDELVRRQPGDTSFRLRRAEARMRAGQLNDASTELEELLVASPNLARAQMLLGVVRLEMGVTNAALQLLREATTNDPSSSDAYYSLGYGLLRAGDGEAAEVAFGRALELNPADPDALLRLSDLLAGRLAWPEAAERLDALARLYPESADIQYRAARALALAGRPADARGRLEACLALEGDNVRALNDLSWLLATCPDDAVRDGARALELALKAEGLTQYRDPVVIDSLAASYAALGDFGGAVEAARRALPLASEPLAGCLARRLALYESGQPYRELPGQPCP